MERIPTRAYLEEPTIRLDTITRFVEAQGHSSAECRDEAVSIAREMVKRAAQLRETLRVSKGTNTTLTLDQLRDTLSGMALCAIVREYDRALNELQNVIGDEVYAYEATNERPDSAGRDALDNLEAVHLKLHTVMREIVGAAAL
jgi:hypothetical protein